VEVSANETIEHGFTLHLPLPSVTTILMAT
jgi:hypothetical protein